MNRWSDAVVAQQDQRDDEEDHAERHPRQLLTREGVRVAQRLVGQVEAAQHREPEAVERGHERQQHRVGIGRDDAHGDVGGDDQRRQPAAVADDVGGHGSLDPEADGGVGADADREREDSRNSSAPRRRRCTKPMRVPV